ncbi:MAG: HIT domain-containing protein [Candidatus Latescibacteria bacterium]|nr:HIT domain-containing protein [Candidatus Latescibacterota bacterium]
MNHLWAPWRAEYIAGGTKEAGCIFCTKPQQDNDAETYILHRGTVCFVIMNLYPYNNGHLMIVPYRHVADVDMLTAEESAGMMSVLQTWLRVLKQAMAPHGFNVGMNLGRVAGAGIEEHLHIHVVPRWNGDTNFMPVVGETKVISEGLDQTYRKLKEHDEALRRG